MATPADANPGEMQRQLVDRGGLPIHLGQESRMVGRLEKKMCCVPDFYVGTPAARSRRRKLERNADQSLPIRSDTQRSESPNRSLTLSS